MTRSTPAQRRFTVEEYFRIERDSTEKHEYRDGEIVSMAGGTVAHSRIIANCIQTLGNRLRGGPCAPFESNLRVRIARRTLYSYPDVPVICGPPELDPDDTRGETVTNPRLVVEVLSPSTESYDRRTKFDRYRQLESFREYVLVSQDMPRVETFFRHDDGTWVFAVATGPDAVIRLSSLGIDLPLAEVYAGVEFPPPPPDPAQPDT